MCFALFSRWTASSFSPLTFVKETQYVFCAVDTVGVNTHSFIHFLLYSTTGPQALGQRVLYRVGSSASPFNFLYPLLSIRSYCSCLRLLPLPHASIPVSVFPSIWVLQGSPHAKCDQSSSPSFLIFRARYKHLIFLSDWKETIKENCA